MTSGSAVALEATRPVGRVGAPEDRDLAVKDLIGWMAALASHGLGTGDFRVCTEFGGREGRGWRRSDSEVRACLACLRPEDESAASKSFLFFPTMVNSDNN